MLRLPAEHALLFVLPLTLRSPLQQADCTEGLHIPELWETRMALVRLQKDL